MMEDPVQIRSRFGWDSNDAASEERRPRHNPTYASASIEEAMAEIYLSFPRTI